MDKTILDKIKALFNDASDDDTEEEVFDAKGAYDALAKDMADMKAAFGAKDAAVAPESDKMGQVLELLQKLLAMEEEEAKRETAEMSTDANDANDVKVVIPAVSNDSDDSVMTPAKLNAVAAQYYKKG